jgi:hypothetical protein
MIGRLSRTNPPENEFEYANMQSSQSAVIRHACARRFADARLAAGTFDFAVPRPRLISLLKRKKPNNDRTPLLRREHRSIYLTRFSPDRFHLPRCEAIRNLVRQQQNRPENTKHARFSECRRTLHRQTDRQIKWRCFTHRRAHSPPAHSPAANQRYETNRPNEDENSGNHARVWALNPRRRKPRNCCGERIADLLNESGKLGCRHESRWRDRRSGMPS